MYYNYLVSEGLQGTHMNALNPFNSKLMTLPPKGGLWTFSAILALCAPFSKIVKIRSNSRNSVATPLIRIMSKKVKKSRSHRYNLLQGRKNGHLLHTVPTLPPYKKMSTLFLHHTCIMIYIKVQTFWEGHTVWPIFHSFLTLLSSVKL